MKQHQLLNLWFQDQDPIQNDVKGMTDFLIKAYHKVTFSNDADNIVQDFENQYKREYRRWLEK